MFHEYKFLYFGLIKQFRLCYETPVVPIQAHRPDRRLCIYVVVKEYL